MLSVHLVRSRPQVDLADVVDFLSCLPNLNRRLRSRRRVSIMFCCWDPEVKEVRCKTGGPSTILRGAEARFEHKSGEGSLQDKQEKSSHQVASAGCEGRQRVCKTFADLDQQCMDKSNLVAAFHPHPANGRRIAAAAAAAAAAAVPPLATTADQHDVLPQQAKQQLQQTAETIGGGSSTGPDAGSMVMSPFGAAMLKLLTSGSINRSCYSRQGSSQTISQVS